MKLNSLILDVTNGCNLRCRMCGIWKEEKKYFLSLQKIAELVNSKVIDGKIVSVSITGGECFLHPDILNIYKFLVLMTKKKRIGNIDIVSNGIMTEKIIEFLRENKKISDGLDLELSIDGQKEMHEFQRRVSGSYEKTISTIIAIKRDYPKVRLSVKYTINGHNQKDILPVYDFCKKYGITFIPKLIE